MLLYENMERHIFYSPELNRQNVEVSVESAESALVILRSESLKKEIKDGNVTLAMVRPRVGPEANIFGLADQETADTIEEMIEGLGIMAKFSIPFSPNTVEEFYRGGPQASMSKEPPRDSTNYDSRWPEFIDSMTSAPTTILLLHSPNHDAIDKWRRHLGHWNIDEFRDPSTIRGKLGVNKYNNLVHGSDASESVLREIDIISRQLEESINKEEARDHMKRQLEAFTGNQAEKEWLANAGLIEKSTDSYELFPHHGWRRLGGESYVMDFSIVTETDQKRLVSKACIKIPPAAVMQEWLERRSLLKSNGLSTPYLYALRDATLLEEYIPFTLGEAYKDANQETQSVLKTQFIEAYTKLHELGFQPMSLHDVRSRGDDVVFVDFGEDLGGILGPSHSKLENINARAAVIFANIIKR